MNAPDNHSPDPFVPSPDQFRPSLTELAIKNDDPERGECSSEIGSRGTHVQS